MGVACGCRPRPRTVCDAAVDAVTIRRAAVVAVVVGCVLVSVTGPVVAIDAPRVTVGFTPPDGPPGPEFPTKQNRQCLSAGLLPDTDTSQPPPPSVALGLDRARTLSRGSGVTIAVIDTGVQPSRRLPNLAGGGDYVTTGGDGLSDCDAHGTLVAGIIGGAADPGDAFVGVAPEARLISIRHRSDAYSAERPANTGASEQLSVEVRTLARAIVRAANLNADIITVPRPICIPANLSLTVDQSLLSAAIGYAVRSRNALIVAGAGDAAGSGCEQNPDIDPTRADDPRNWDGVVTISTPGWYASDVLSVGFTSATGAVMAESLAGPWVSVAGPGTAIESLGPGGKLVNGVGSGSDLTPVGGSAFAAAYVSGVAALLRSRFPSESPADIVTRLRAGAHSPARGVDNSVGSGLIDPVVALSYRTPPESAPESGPRALVLPIPAPKDGRPRLVVAGVLVGVVLLGAGVVGAATLRGREP